MEISEKDWMIRMCCFVGQHDGAVTFVDFADFFQNFGAAHFHIVFRADADGFNLLLSADHMLHHRQIPRAVRKRQDFPC